MTVKVGRKSLDQITSLTTQQARAAALLSEGWSGAKVAAAVGVRSATISTWLNRHPAFQQRLAELQVANWSVSQAVTGKASHAGLILCARVIGSEEYNTRDRLAAVATVLSHQRALAEYNLRAKAQQALERRLDALEQRQQEARQSEEYGSVNVLASAA